MTSLAKRKLKKDITGYLFCAPLLILFSVFMIYPMFSGVYQSFTNYNLLFKYDFIGLDNYKTLFTTSVFRQEFFNSLLYVLLWGVISVPIGIFVGMGIAVVLNNSRYKGNKIFRVIYYVPALTSSVSSALIWQWIFNYSMGPITEILQTIGLKPVNFFDNKYKLLVVFLIMGLWGGTGSMSVMYTAALQGIRGEIIEAARIDGANNVQTFWKITFPLLAPMTTYQLTMSIIGALQMFDPVFLLGQATPGAVTPAYLIYNYAFRSSRMAGFAAAHAVLLFIIIMILTFTVRKINKESYIV